MFDGCQLPTEFLLRSAEDDVDWMHSWPYEYKCKMGEAISAKDDTTTQSLEKMEIRDWTLRDQDMRQSD